MPSFRTSPPTPKAAEAVEAPSGQGACTICRVLEPSVKTCLPRVHDYIEDLGRRYQAFCPECFGFVSDLGHEGGSDLSLNCSQLAAQHDGSDLHLFLGAEAIALIHKFFPGDSHA